MNVELTSEIIYAILFIIGVFISIYRCFNGRKAEEPSGFGGFVESLFVYIFIIWLLWSGGMFDKIVELF